MIVQLTTYGQTHFMKRINYKEMKMFFLQFYSSIKMNTESSHSTYRSATKDINTKIPSSHLSQMCGVLLNISI